MRPVEKMKTDLVELPTLRVLLARRSLPPVPIIGETTYPLRLV